MNSHSVFKQSTLIRVMLDSRKLLADSISPFTHPRLSLSIYINLLSEVISLTYSRFRVQTKYQTCKQASPT